LHSTPLTATEDVLGLNLTRGCVHRCVFCSVRAYPGYRGDEQIETDPYLLDKLELELQSRCPRVVHVSPSTDPFPPMRAVQELTAGVVKVLAVHDTEAWLMTRGLIRPAAFDVLKEHRDRVRVTVSLTTTDRTLQRRLEPWTAPPSLRLDQLRRLREAGIPTQVALDPLVPNVTDTASNLEPLLGSLAELGVRQVTAGYMFLREGISNNLERELRGTGLDEIILGEFRNGPIMTASGMASARYLPKSRRQRGFARLMSLAARHDIKVSISALSNPDFAAPSRTLPVAGPRPSLLALFRASQKRA
jgi:DNA repair photolyase